MRKSIPVEGEPISCDNCKGDCCRGGTLILLRRDEVKRHQASMGLLKLAPVWPEPRQYMIEAEAIDESGNRVPAWRTINVPRNHGAFVLVNDCLNLTPDGRCAIYEDRPNACRKYEVGSPECIESRAAMALERAQASNDLVESPEATTPTAM